MYQIQKNLKKKNRLDYQESLEKYCLDLVGREPKNFEKKNRLDLDLNDM